MFWSGAGRHLQESYHNGSWPGPLDTTTSFGMGTATSGPGIAVGDDNQQFLFRLSADGYIEEVNLTDHWACCYDFPGWGTATSAPVVAADPGNDDQCLFWRGSCGYVHEAWYGGSWHCCSDFTSWSTAAAAPAVAVDPGNDDQYVFWRGTDGYLRETCRDGGWIGPTTMTSCEQTSSTPLVESHSER